MMGNATASNSNFILAAYAITWIAVLIYAWRLHRSAHRARAEFERASRETQAS